MAFASAAGATACGFSWLPPAPARGRRPCRTAPPLARRRTVDQLNRQEQGYRLPTTISGREREGGDNVHYSRNNSNHGGSHESRSLCELCAAVSAAAVAWCVI